MTRQEIDNIIDNSSASSSAGIGGVVYPTTTPISASANEPALLSMGEYKDILNDLVNYNQFTGAYGIKPNMISGYGNRPDDMSEYIRHDLYNSVIQNAADADALDRVFNILQGAEEYKRQQRLDDSANQMRQEDLYGTVLSDMLNQTPKGASLMEKIVQKPSSRQRNVQGQGAGGFIPAGSPNYPGGVGFW